MEKEGDFKEREGDFTEREGDFTETGDLGWGRTHGSLAGLLREGSARKTKLCFDKAHLL